METYSSLQKPVTFMCFWLNYWDKNHIERIPVVVKNIAHLFSLSSEIIETDRFHLFLLSDSTQIDNNEYLESLENGTELIICTEEQIQKLSIYFELKRYLSLKNLSYPLNIDYFIWRLAAFSKITLMFIEAVLSSTSSHAQSVFIVFSYDFGRVKDGVERKWNEKPPKRFSKQVQLLSFVESTSD